MAINTTKGFTLIELLVVISIIGLLSSVVLASLNTARARAKDTAIKQGVQQLRNVLALEYSDNGNYTNLLMGWMGDPVDCSQNVNAAAGTVATNGYGSLGSVSPLSGSFRGTYATKATQICANIVKNSAGTQNLGLATGANSVLWIGTVGGGTDQMYSVMAFLPGAKTLYCVSYTGKTSSNSGAAMNGDGCWGNP